MSTQIFLPGLYNQVRRSTLRGVAADCLKTEEYDVLQGCNIVSTRNILYGQVDLPVINARLTSLFDFGIKTWLTFFEAPTEMRAFPYGPIRAEYMEAWAQWAVGIASFLPVEILQIWNEPDLYPGVKDHYGGWGAYHFKDFSMLMRSVQAASLKIFAPGTRKLAVSISRVGTFLDDLDPDCFDMLFLHHYENYSPGKIPSTKGLEEALVYLKTKFPGKQIALTETSLLTETDPEDPDDFAAMKHIWFTKAIRISDVYRLFAVVAYSLRNPWYHCEVTENDLALFKEA